MLTLQAPLWEQFSQHMKQIITRFIHAEKVLQMREASKSKETLKQVEQVKTVNEDHALSRLTLN